jgi:glycosyltransferase involved in cell wall biosynthesis
VGLALSQEERDPELVTYVTAEGTSSMPVTSQLLGERLGVRELHTDVYLGMEERFNIPLLGFRAARAFWRDLQLVVDINRAGGLVHLSNHHQGRYGAFLRSPYLITVHDLIRYFDLKRSEPLIERPDVRERFLLRLDFLGIRRAVRIVAVSQHTKSDLVEHLGVPEEKINVVYHGLDRNLYHPVNAPRPVPYPYLLYVGSEHPRKNISTLLRAFSRIKRDRRFRELKLVKVGKAGDPEADFRRPVLDEIKQLRLEPSVIFAGFVPQE